MYIYSKLLIFYQNNAFLTKNNEYMNSYLFCGVLDMILLIFFVLTELVKNYIICDCITTVPHFLIRSGYGTGTAIAKHTKVFKILFLCLHKRYRSRLASLHFLIMLSCKYNQTINWK